MTIDTESPETQAFLDKLLNIPKEVTDLFLAHTIAPESRETVIQSLERMTTLCEEQWIREELDDINDQIKRLQTRRGRKAIYKIHQLQKRAIGLQASIVDLKKGKPTECRPVGSRKVAGSDTEESCRTHNPN